MATKKLALGKKILLAGVGAAAVASAIAAAVALSDEKNRTKVKQIAGQLKAKSEDVIAELKKLAAATTKAKKGKS